MFCHMIREREREKEVKRLKFFFNNTLPLSYIKTARQVKQQKDLLISISYDFYIKLY